ncbi:hypothetical protein [Leptolyngbya ohadii]|uniref:hypothetical protein n=1 Tax=Leptolyngbya ohadii TaxID=1962290 RepID=UPI000B59C446|nr:hypothetical protein [Leptolyngbya ohadii]
MIENIFKGSIALAVLVAVAGIVAAPLVGSQKSFEFAPVWSAGRFTWEWFTQSAQDAKQPEENPKPFTEEVKAAGDRLSTATQSALQNVPAMLSDPRLSICPPGSLNQADREIPLTLATKIKEKSGEFKSLFDLQMKLDEPACIINSDGGTQWRYLVTDGKIIDAIERGNQLEMKFTGF